LTSDLTAADGRTPQLHASGHRGESASLEDVRPSRRAASQIGYSPVNVPANAPVKKYWSVTVYDGETHALIRDVSRPSRSSQSQRPSRK